MSKRNVVIILILALTLFFIGQLTTILDIPDSEDLITSIIFLTVFYLFAAPVLAFACTVLWQPRVKSLIDDKKKLDDNLYRHYRYANSYIYSICGCTFCLWSWSQLDGRLSAFSCIL